MSASREAVKELTGMIFGSMRYEKCYKSVKVKKFNNNTQQQHTPQQNTHKEEKNKKEAAVRNGVSLGSQRGERLLPLSCFLGARSRLRTR
jgi:hypothetical protein